MHAVPPQLPPPLNTTIHRVNGSALYFAPPDSRDGGGQ